MSASKGISSVCVFCGSRPGGNPRFTEAAYAFGRLLAEQGRTLVYGGARVGVMGAVAAGALEAGGKVIGVIPRALVSKEIAHDGLSELYLTESMASRKERMIEISDAFVALPGGYGTFDELFETITLAQIGLHDKPNALLDVDGFFAPLEALLRHTIAHAFAAEEHAGLVVSASDPAALLAALDTWSPPPFGSRAMDRRRDP